MRMTGKVVMVTGAGSGNGRAFALGFAREGARVAAVDVNAAASNRTAEEVRRIGAPAAAIQADVASAADVQRAVQSAIDELGPIDILINNAGIRGTSSFVEMSEAEWDRHLDVDLKGPFLCMQAVAREMIRLARGGSIINITSMMSQQAARNRAAYCTTKAGLAMLTRVAAIELAEYGIRVNAIAPGFIETPLTAPLLATRDAVEAAAGRIPLGRIGQTEDLVGPALFLASSEAAFVTGVNFLVDGGQVAAGPATWSQAVLTPLPVSL